VQLSIDSLGQKIEAMEQTPTPASTPASSGASSTGGASAVPMPEMAMVGGAVAPVAPAMVEKTGVDANILADLALKLCNTVPRLTTDWAAHQLCLPISVIDRLFWQLREDQFLEILGQTGPMTYRFAITQRGREYARRLLEISGYVGPAPVSLDAYAALLEWQVARQPRATLERVREALGALVLRRPAMLRRPAKPITRRRKEN
jgi:hypothetical protein